MSRVRRASSLLAPCLASGWTDRVVLGVARTYIRDGRAPLPADERTSALMSRIRGRNTGPEKALRKALAAAGVRGYRLHYDRVPGRPDLAFVRPKVAVFVHGCFWHGCPNCRPQRPGSHRAFWGAKLDGNKARDRRKTRQLRKAGWCVLTVWECRLRKHAGTQVARVKRSLAQRFTGLSCDRTTA